MQISTDHTIDYRIFGVIQIACQKINMSSVAVPGGSTCCSPSSSSCSCGAVSVDEAIDLKQDD